MHRHRQPVHLLVHPALVKLSARALALRHAGRLHGQLCFQSALHALQQHTGGAGDGVSAVLFLQDRLPRSHLLRRVRLVRLCERAVPRHAVHQPAEAADPPGAAGGNAGADTVQPVHPPSVRDRRLRQIRAPRPVPGADGGAGAGHIRLFAAAAVPGPRRDGPHQAGSRAAGGHLPAVPADRLEPEHRGRIDPRDLRGHHAGAAVPGDGHLHPADLHGQADPGEQSPEPDGLFGVQAVQP